MKYIQKIFVILVVCLSVACGQKDQTIYLEKDGNLYEVTKQVSFYYPKEFVFNTNNDNTNIVQFVNENEMFYYVATTDDTDNAVEDMPNLYAGQLEEDGAQNVEYHVQELESGLKCYVFTGLFSSTGLKFKHIAYFTSKATYSYGYQAPENVYDDNISLRTQYLESLTVHH